MNLHLCVHRARRIAPSPSPPSWSPDESANDGALGFVIATPRIPCCMTASVVALTPNQIRQNIMEDAREYQDE